MRALLLVAALFASQGLAQDINVTPLDPLNSLDPLGPRDPQALPGLEGEGFIAASPQPQAVTGTGAVLRGLDKVSGEVFEFDLQNGGESRVGRLTVSLSECRYPQENPDGDAYAWIEVIDTARGSILFQGWMIASSPALNPLDHPRYDVWVLRCITA